LTAIAALGAIIDIERLMAGTVPSFLANAVMFHLLHQEEV